MEAKDGKLIRLFQFPSFIKAIDFVKTIYYPRWTEKNILNY